MWLNNQGLDIICFRLKPYGYDEKVFVDIQQIIPLPEATDYQIQLREKESEKKKARQQTRDLTKYDLNINGKEFLKLPKRRLIYQIVKAAIENDITSPEELQKIILRNNIWMVVEGECKGEEFHKKAEIHRKQENKLYEPHRCFSNDEELIFYNGKTYAFTKMWGLNTPQMVDKILDKYPQLNAQYDETENL